MADGDYRTHWTARDWWYNEHVVVTFREPQDLQAAIWVPRLDGNHAANLRAYSVLVWYEGDDLNGPGRHVTPGTDNNGNTDGGDVQTWPGIRGNPAVTKFAVMPFAPQKDVVQISVAAEQAGYVSVSLSELMFLKYDENHRLPDEIGELFADELHTALAPGVTQARINELRGRLNSDERNYYMDLDTMADELVLAQELLDSGRSSGVIVDGIDSRSSGRDNGKYGQRAAASGRGRRGRAGDRRLCRRHPRRGEGDGLRHPVQRRGLRVAGKGGGAGQRPERPHHSPDRQSEHPPGRQPVYHLQRDRP